MILLIILNLAINLAVFVSYPMSGVMGFTFLYISALLWTAFAIFIGRIVSQGSVFIKVVLTLVFVLLCAFLTLSFLPQIDKTTALSKFSDGKYPDNRTIYMGLLRLGIDYPGLLPPAPPEKPV